MLRRLPGVRTLTSRSSSTTMSDAEPVFAVSLTDIKPVTRFIVDVLELADDHTLTETQLRDGLERAIDRFVQGMNS